MATTKTKRRYAIDLPEEAMQVLRWHVDTQLETPEMQESDLLFPSVTGKYRSPSVLNDPFADVAEMIGLGKCFTQRGLRRTFQDLARAAQVEGIVTRSISGHATERMRDHYSTVDGAEKKTALAKSSTSPPIATALAVGSTPGRWGAKQNGLTSEEANPLVLRTIL